MTFTCTFYQVFSLTAHAYTQPCIMSKPIPVAVRCKEVVDCRLIAGITSSNPAEGVDFLLYMLCGCVGSGLCDELITSSEESYRV